MLKRLVVLALALAGGWIAYRRLVAPPQPSAQFDAPYTPPPPAARPLPDAPHAPPPDVAEQAAPHAHAEHAAEPDAEPLEAYCVRCREQRPIQDMRIETTAAGRRAAKGTCPVCGAKLNRFLPSLEA